MTTQCWNAFCIAEDCDDVHHYDYTGHSWTQRRGTEYNPQPCDYCGTVWDTEAQAWECSHNDRMEARDLEEQSTYLRTHGRYRSELDNCPR